MTNSFWNWNKIVIYIMWNWLCQKNPLFNFNFQVCNGWSSILEKNCGKFRSIIMSRFWDIVVSLHCLWKSTKQALLHFPLSAHAQHWSTRWGHAIWQKRQKQNKFLKKTSGYFSQLVLAIFLENFIGWIFSPDKYVNRRGIKHFKGRKLRGFYLL